MYRDGVFGAGEELAGNRLVEIQSPRLRQVQRAADAHGIVRLPQAIASPEYVMGGVGMKRRRREEPTLGAVSVHGYVRSRR